MHWQNPPANTEEAGDEGSIPGSGRSPGKGKGNLRQHSCLEDPMERRAWGAAVHGVAESVMTGHAHTGQNVSFFLQECLSHGSLCSIMFSSRPRSNPPRLAAVSASQREAAAGSGPGTQTWAGGELGVCAPWVMAGTWRSLGLLGALIHLASSPFCILH